MGVRETERYRKDNKGSKKYKEIYEKNTRDMKKEKETSAEKRGRG